MNEDGRLMRINWMLGNTRNKTQKKFFISQHIKLYWNNTNFLIINIKLWLNKIQL